MTVKGVDKALGLVEASVVIAGKPLGQVCKESFVIENGVLREEAYLASQADDIVLMTVFSVPSVTVDIIKEACVTVLFTNKQKEATNLTNDYCIKNKVNLQI